MLKIKLPTVMVLVIACSQVGYAEENPVPAKNPVQPAQADRQSMSNQFWWPERLDLAPLRQHSAKSSPLDSNFNYAQEFKKLDLKAVKKDIEKLMKTSQDWWPADYGHYGPFLSAWLGTARVLTAWVMGVAGLGAVNSALNRSTVGPIMPIWIRRGACFGRSKSKYGSKISWADLIVLTGNVALESMGFKTFGLLADELMTGRLI